MKTTSVPGVWVLFAALLLSIPCLGQSARLKDDYVPRGFHLGAGAIKGDEFGLRLSPDDRRALIAFLNKL
jgi:hypothetical protein